MARGLALPWLLKQHGPQLDLPAWFSSAALSTSRLPEGVDKGSSLHGSLFQDSRGQEEPCFPWRCAPPAGGSTRDALPLSLTLSNKPNPNQISVNNVKAGVVNGTGAPGQSPGAGRACESCYSKCLLPGARPSPQRWAPCPIPGPGLEGGGRILPEEALLGDAGCLGRGGRLGGRVGGRQLCNALCRHWFCSGIRLSPTLLSVATQSYQWYSWGPPNMQCRLCASCWTYWKKYGGLKMPTRLDGERPGPNRSNMVSGHPPRPCAWPPRLACGHGAVSGRRAPFRRAPTASQPGVAGAPSLP